ncbi:MAG: ABC transporter ATP-binding protein [Betaproteobacteria bacterium]|nr:ABC transporter ATP-binding protein [Betaproteobacteria bacterium]
MVPAIQVEQVVKRYGELQALAGVSLEIAQGEFFGLLGPNGAGKTTLISILAGLAIASSGSARIMGHDVIAAYRQARRALGVVPQELVFDPFFTVREALTIQSGYFGMRDNRAWIDELLHHLDLTGKADTNMRQLSGGMKRRVLIGQALAHKPPVIVLDEPTAGVDVELRQSLWQFIRRLNRDGHTIVLTTHYLEEAEALCGRIAMLKQGEIVANDSTQNLLQRFSGCYVNLKLAPHRLPEALQPLLAQQDESGFRLALRSYDEMEHVMAALRSAGAKVQEMEVMQPDLEEVFVKIMSRERVNESRFTRGA